MLCFCVQNVTFHVLNAFLLWFWPAEREFDGGTCLANSFTVQISTFTVQKRVNTVQTNRFTVQSRTNTVQTLIM